MGKRTKTHILKIMGRFLLVWMKHPYQRLGQLICNVFQDEPYHVEDEVFINKLEGYSKDV